jgi:hypothetical protein
MMIGLLLVTDEKGEYASHNQGGNRDTSHYFHG